MPVIREQIKFLGDDINLSFGLSSDDNFLGLDQEVDNLTEVVSTDLINPNVDLEERKYKSSSPNTSTIEFQFYNPQNNTYVTNFTNGAGFTLYDIFSNQPCALNSFFILDYYDSFDTNTQTKIATTYLTKIGITSIYSLTSTNQTEFFNMYVPLSYINAQTGTTVTGYSKFTFYNAKSGTTALFYNYNNRNLTTPEKMYFKTVLNLVNKTWQIIYPANAVTAIQLITSPTYNQKVNDTIGNFNNEVQNYPSGSTFNYIDGKYI